MTGSLKPARVRCEPAPTSTRMNSPPAIIAMHEETLFGLGIGPPEPTRNTCILSPLSNLLMLLLMIFPLFVLKFTID
ncbi:MAG: hypothetical protein ACFFFT_04775 [Candidatus Thorarchaeota archaeon]